MTRHDEEFDKLPSPYQSLDENGNIRHVNQQWLNLLGFTYDEVIGHNFSEFISDEFKTLFPMRFESFKEVGSVSQVYFLMVHKDGHFIPVQIDGKIEKSDEGLSAQCLLDDVSKEKTTESFYRQLFTYSNSGVVIYQPINHGEDFEIIDVNPRVEEIEKIPRASLIGQKVTEVFTGVRDTPIFKGFQEVYQTGETKYIPITLYKDNERTGFRTNTITKLPNNQLYVVYNDDTELEFSRRLLNTTLNTINTIICTTIGGEHLFSCNDYFLKVFGYKNLEEFKQDHECVCDYFIEDKTQGYIGAYVDGIKWTTYIMKNNHDKLVKTKMNINGSEQIYSIHIGKLLLDKEDRYLVVLDNITLQEQYEQSLKEEIENQTKKINHLYHLMSLSEKITNHGVIEINLTTGEETWTDGIYQLIEDEKRITQPSRENGLKFIHEQDIEYVQQSRKDSVDHGEVETLEYRIVTMKGNLRYNKIMGHITGNKLILIVQDTTQDKLYEQLNEENRKLQIRQHHLNSLKQMFKNISHHWRQPLNVIVLSTESLKDHYHENTLTEDILDEYANTIINESQYLSHTINHFSELTTNTQEKTSLNLKDKIITVISLHKPNLDSQDISVETELENITIVTTPNELSRVIFSLIENSIESIIKQKEKEPETQGKIKITLNENHGFVKISIKDNGVGMSDELKEKIFEPYFTTKFQSRGVGLSLSVDQHIINTVLKGEITINNQSDEGVEFIIEFPSSQE